MLGRSAVRRIPPAGLRPLSTLLGDRCALRMRKTPIMRCLGKVTRLPLQHQRAYGTSPPLCVRLGQINPEKQRKVDDLNDPLAYTEQTWSALNKLPQYASQYQQQYMEVPLLLHALLAEGKDQLAARMLSAAGVDVDLLINRVKTRLVVTFVSFVSLSLSISPPPASDLFSLPPPPPHLTPHIFRLTHTSRPCPKCKDLLRVAI
jgi:hypothetical protein